MTGLTDHMTSLEHLTCLVDCDVCNKSVWWTSIAMVPVLANHLQLLVCIVWTVG